MIRYNKYVDTASKPTFAANMCSQHATSYREHTFRNTRDLQVGEQSSSSSVCCLCSNFITCLLACNLNLRSASMSSMLKRNRNTYFRTRITVLGPICVCFLGFFHSVGGLKDLPFIAQRSLRHRAHWSTTQARRAQPNQPPTGQDDALYCHGLRVLVGLARSRARREARRRPNSARRLHGTNQI